jgi:bacillithiol biosynthesis cysteine-adding enzyme BshC
MASEDHDYDEIKSFNLFGKKYTWETEQTGAVGKFSTESIKNILEELPEKTPLFEKAYQENGNLSSATRIIVNELFGKYGLVCIDGDSRELKGLFKEVIKDDLQNHKANDLSGNASEKLNKLGYQSQVYPRSINLFYCENGFRQRIVKEHDHYQVMETDLSFNANEILDLVEKKPEVFSPNVILRPLYQEIILPNLAYIGGPAEVAYWLQLKVVFDNYKIPFPILLPRNFALVINKNIHKKIETLGIKADELFFDFQELKQVFLTRNSDTEISIEKEIKEISDLFEHIKNKANKVDKSLEGFIAAEGVKTNKSLDNISKRLRKSEEKRQEIEINQLENVLNKLFPNGGLQERHDNFLNFYLNNPDFIEDLKAAFDPLDFRFNIISYNE